MRLSRHPIRGILLTPFLLLFQPVFAYVDLSFDAVTMQEALTALAPERVEVEIAGRKVDIVLSDLKIESFQPSASATEPGYIETSMTLRIPAFGLKSAVQPTLHFEILDPEKAKGCRLKIRNVPLEIPMLGTLDVGPLLPSFDLPIEHLAGVSGPRGETLIRSTLTEITIGTRVVRLRFDVGLTPTDDLVKPESP
jgi:hypothetical protein